MNVAAKPERVRRWSRNTTCPTDFARTFKCITRALKWIMAALKWIKTPLKCTSQMVASRRGRISNDQLSEWEVATSCPPAYGAIGADGRSKAVSSNFWNLADGCCTRWAEIEHATPPIRDSVADGGGLSRKEEQRSPTVWQDRFSSLPRLHRTVSGLFWDRGWSAPVAELSSTPCIELSHGDGKHPQYRPP